MYEFFNHAQVNYMYVTKIAIGHLSHSIGPPISYLIVRKLADHAQNLRLMITNNSPTVNPVNSLQRSVSKKLSKPITNSQFKKNLPQDEQNSHYPP
jgi:hypothetical protein